LSTHTHLLPLCSEIPLVFSPSVLCATYNSLQSLRSRRRLECDLAQTWSMTPLCVRLASHSSFKDLSIAPLPTPTDDVCSQATVL
jgi:hypothetical protein